MKNTQKKSTIALIITILLFIFTSIVGCFIDQSSKWLYLIYFLLLVLTTIFIVLIAIRTGEKANKKDLDKYTKCCQKYEFKFDEQYHYYRDIHNSFTGGTKKQVRIDLFVLEKSVNSRFQ